MTSNNRPHRQGFVEACLSQAPESARMWIESLSSIAGSDIQPYAGDVDRTGRYPREAVATLRNIGAFGVSAPKDVGGLGYGDAVAALAVEVVAAACPSTAAVLMFHYQVVRRVASFGDESWRLDDLRRLASGEWLGSSAWTEFGAGADKGQTLTRLTHENEKSCIFGAKHFCTGLEGASLIHVLLDAGDGRKFAPTFVRVVVDNKGVDCSEIYPLLGLRGSSTGTIQLNGAPVNDDCVIDKVGTGGVLMGANHSVFMNPGLIAMGIATTAFKYATDTALGKAPKSRDITGFQATRFKLADIAGRIALVYALAESAVNEEARGETVAPSEFLRIKLEASEAAVYIAESAMRLAGGRGFHAGWPYERYLRDAFATVLMGPANEIIKEKIAERILSEPVVAEETANESVQRHAEIAL